MHKRSHRAHGKQEETSDVAYDATTETRGSSGDLLRVDGLSLQFGGIQALAGVSLSVGRDAICGLVGPNGRIGSTIRPAMDSRQGAEDSSRCLDRGVVAAMKITPAFGP